MTKNKQRISKIHSGNTVKKVIGAIGLVLLNVLIIIMLFFGIVGKELADWYKKTFHTTFREIVYTFGLGIKGADASFMRDAIYECRYEIASFIAVLIVFFLLELLILIQRRILTDAREQASLLYKLSFPISILLILIVSAGLCVPTFRYADKVLKVKEFLKLRFSNTRIYDDYYVGPGTVKILQSGEKRNLILIYLESMETTYVSRDLGGYQDENLIPNLTKLANNNISFGDREKDELGGIHNPYGTTWTTAAILASMSGVPFAFRVGMNQGGKEEPFASKLVTLGDFLKDEGYNQVFLCGSDSEFGGRKAFFEQHGDYQIEDYNTAVERGYIENGYYVWWGYEDHKLYEIAKERLTDLSEEAKPFNFTMLTVDTHHVGGYECKYCPDTYKQSTANVVACADAQVQDFIDWCKKQDFYENTTIVILGDHPRMDKKLVKGVDSFERETYNCFINSAKEPVQNGKRTAVTMDMFPTILSSMGYEIEGDRLGLGTDLFSDKKTLAEEISYDKLNDEVGRNSKYYLKNFD